jgi:urease accessory protein
MASIFPPSTPAGNGIVHLTHDPPQFRTLRYAYPLKLISPSPLTYHHNVIQTLFLLTYGGGLVAGDTVDLNITLEAHTSLILLTQGSTKIFKTPDPNLVSGQRMSVSIAAGAALCYIPDPIQPFADCAFEQSQVYHLKATTSSLCACDWVSCGRAARGEKWNFWKYGSRNEVWDISNPDRKVLMLRDNMILESDSNPDDGVIATKMDQLGAFGTLILRGPAFDSVASFFLDEFERLPRIGAKKWGDEVEELDSRESWRKARRQQETKDGLTWTAANVRGFVMVKFGGRDVEAVKHWMGAVLKEEGSIERRFGERALLCLK